MTDSTSATDNAPVIDDACAIVLEQTHYRYAGSAHDSLCIPHLRIAAQERVFVQGKSGSGKTTLLNLIAGVGAATSGRVCVLGQDLHSMSAAKRDRFRADSLGVIFQQFNLIPYLSVLENVRLPELFRTTKPSDVQARERVQQLLSALELPAQLLHTKAAALSVGQQQRVAVVRALAGSPKLVIADEPTSALDADNRDRFMDLLFAEVQRCGATLVFVSHDRQLAHWFTQTVDLAEINVAENSLTEIGKVAVSA